MSTTENETWDLGDVTLREVPVRIGGHDYVLREASEAAAVEWRNSQLAGVTFDPTSGKPKTVNGVASIEPTLVSRCLFRIGPDGKTTIPVNIKTISGWPQAKVKALYDKVKELSGLDEEEKKPEGGEGDDSKNSPAGTETSSD